MPRREQAILLGSKGVDAGNEVQIVPACGAVSFVCVEGRSVENAAWMMEALFEPVIVRIIADETSTDKPGKHKKY